MVSPPPSPSLPPTSPKKRSLMPSGELRRTLRGHGHALSALVQVGKAGVTGRLRKQLSQVLLDHELVKVKIAAECPADRFQVAEQLDAEPGVSVVQILGRTILLYKRHPQTPRYEGKLATPEDPATRKGTRASAGVSSRPGGRFNRGGPSGAPREKGRSPRRGRPSRSP